MIYNEKYKRFIDDDYVIYRMDKEGRLVQVKPCINNCGYHFFCYAQSKVIYVHRFVWETLKGPVPQGYEIDHINTIKTDNRIENLRCVTHKENMNNPLTIKKRSKSIRESLKNNTNAKGKVHSDFGKKYKEHFGITARDNLKQYHTELCWYIRHKKCRWE